MYTSPHKGVHTCIHTSAYVCLKVPAIRNVDRIFPANFCRFRANLATNDGGNFRNLAEFLTRRKLFFSVGKQDIEWWHKTFDFGSNLSVCKYVDCVDFVTLVVCMHACMNVCIWVQFVGL